jgi:hypothetical protein
MPSSPRSSPNGPRSSNKPALFPSDGTTCTEVAGHSVAMRMNWRTPLCDRLGIAHPIFGFSHSVDVVVEIDRAGGYPVLGLAREMPHEIPEILRAVDERMHGMPYGVDLMLPSQVPQSGDIAQVRAALPRQHLDFVAGLRK